jgi:uncharacterized membrane protein YraQ (UPF0718 family)
MQVRREAVFLTQRRGGRSVCFLVATPILTVRSYAVIAFLFDPDLVLLAAAFI